VTQALGEVEQSTTRLKAVYALHPPLRVDSKSASDLYYKFLEDFASVKAIPIRGSFTHNGELLGVTVRPCTANQKKRHFSKSAFLQIGDVSWNFRPRSSFLAKNDFL
jgi:hypothetical protein